MVPGRAALMLRIAEGMPSRLTLVLQLPHVTTCCGGCCAGTNFCLRARALGSVGWFPEYCITGENDCSQE
jgi:hypothetical protein